MRAAGASNHQRARCVVWRGLCMQLTNLEKNPFGSGAEQHKMEWLVVCEERSTRLVEIVR